MNHSIEVWDITFYKVDEDGKALTDNKGNVQLYTATDRKHPLFWEDPLYDQPHLASLLTEGLDDNDLEEI